MINEGLIWMGLEVSLMINEGLIWMGLGVGLMIMRVNLDGAGGG